VEKLKFLHMVEDDALALKYVSFFVVWLEEKLKLFHGMMLWSRMML
jgi:hypothetical protein